MRRTLTVLAVGAALLAPAGTALAEPGPQAGTSGGPVSTVNASCNNGKGGNGGQFNGHGNLAKLAASGYHCVSKKGSPVPVPTPTVAPTATPTATTSPSPTPSTPGGGDDTDAAGPTTTPTTSPAPSPTTPPSRPVYEDG